MSWFANLRESAVKATSSIATDFAQMAEEVIDQGEKLISKSEDMLKQGLLKMNNTQSVESIEQDAQSLKYLRPATQTLQAWNEAIAQNRRVGHITTAQMARIAQPAEIPASRTSSIKTGAGSATASAAAGGSKDATEANTGVGKEGRAVTGVVDGKTSAKDGKGAEEDGVSTSPGTASVEMLSADNSPGGGFEYTKSDSFEEEPISVDGIVHTYANKTNDAFACGSKGMASSLAANGLVGPNGVRQSDLNPKQKLFPSKEGVKQESASRPITFKHLFLKSRALEFLFQAIHNSNELRVALRPAMFPPDRNAENEDVDGTSDLAGNKTVAAGPVPAASSVVEKKEDTKKKETPEAQGDEKKDGEVGEVKPAEGGAVKLGKVPVKAGDSNLAQQQQKIHELMQEEERRFAMEFWKLMSAIMIPETELVWGELVKLLVSFSQNEAIPAAFFLVLNNLKEDWRSSIYRTDRKHLMDHCETIRGGKTPARSNVTSIKTGALFQSLQEQNQYAIRSQTLLNLLTNLHDSNLHIVERSTSLLADSTVGSWSRLRAVLEKSIASAEEKQTGVKKRKESLEVASKAQKEELVTQIEGITMGKNEITTRITALEEEKKELEEKLQKINAELGDLKEQARRVNTSEIALNKESENALRFYEENIGQLDTEDKRLNREITVARALKAMRESAEKVQVNHLKTEIEERKVSAEDTYTELSTSVVSHFAIEEERLKTGMRLVEQCCLGFQERTQSQQVMEKQGVSKEVLQSDVVGERDMVIELKRSIVSRDKSYESLESFAGRFNRLLTCKENKEKNLVERYEALKKTYKEHKEKFNPQCGELLQKARAATGGAAPGPNSPLDNPLSNPFPNVSLNSVTQIVKEDFGTLFGSFSLPGMEPKIEPRNPGTSKANQAFGRGGNQAPTSGVPMANSSNSTAAGSRIDTGNSSGNSSNTIGVASRIDTSAMNETNSKVLNQAKAVGQAAGEAAGGLTFHAMDTPDQSPQGSGGEDDLLKMFGETPAVPSTTSTTTPATTAAATTASGTTLAPTTGAGAPAPAKQGNLFDME